MTVGLLLDCDEQVANHLFSAYNQPQFKYDRAIGIVKDNSLVGTVLFHYWNGSNVEISYYGKGTMTAGIIRYLAKFAIKSFNPARLTVMTSKRNRRFIRSLQRLGFKLEGAQRRYYGSDDTNRNVGVRFVMFRERLAELAGLMDEESTKCS